MLVLLWFALLIPVMGEELEVRLYRVSEAEIQKAHQARGLKANADDFFGEVVKPEFESRFFDGEGSWRNCAKRVGEILQDKNFEGKAMMNSKRGVMVMKADSVAHLNFESVVKKFFRRKIRVSARVFLVPEKSSGLQAGGLAKIPEDWKSLGELSLAAQLVADGKGSTPDGNLSLEFEAQLAANFNFFEIFFKLEKR